MLVETVSEFWQKELEKIKDPVSGAYYFYINYIKIERNGKLESPPFITEKDFNKVFEQNSVELKTRSRRNWTK